MANAYSKDEIIEKLKKIKNHEESARDIGSIKEAEVFAKMFQKLLVDYELSMSEVEFAQMRDTSPIDKTQINWSEYNVKVGQRIRHAWIEHLASIVVKAYGCTFMVRRGTSHIWIVGRETPRELAEYVLVTLVRSADSISRKENATFSRHCHEAGRPEDAYGFRKSFLLGFTVRIHERLKETTHPDVASNSTAIVRLSTESDDARAWVKAEYSMRTASRLVLRRTENCVGYLTGKKVADAMDIKGRGIENSPTKALEQ